MGTNKKPNVTAVSDVGYLETRAHHMLKVSYISCTYGKDFSLISEMDCITNSLLNV